MGALDYWVLCIIPSFEYSIFTTLRLFTSASIAIFFQDRPILDRNDSCASVR
jgi:hypothetical protein